MAIAPGLKSENNATKIAETIVKFVIPRTN